MAALTQDAWYGDRYPVSDETPARNIRSLAHRSSKARDTAIHFIQSQIGGPLAAYKATGLQTVEYIDF